LIIIFKDIERIRKKRYSFVNMRINKTLRI
jgi:hypothetical protein